MATPLTMALVAAQAIWLRLTTKVLPPGQGPTAGERGDVGDPALRLLVVGESTAAGCGVDHQDDGFAAALADTLAAREPARVEWLVVAEPGATTRCVKDHLLPRLGDWQGDFAVLLVGVNDVLKRRSPQDFGEDLGAILSDVCDRAHRVWVTGTPPFESFPTLPVALGHHLATHARRLDERAREVCAAWPGVKWVPSVDVVELRPNFFAGDHFHPSRLGYRLWANALADEIGGCRR